MVILPGAAENMVEDCALYGSVCIAFAMPFMLQSVARSSQPPEGAFFLMSREKDLTTFVEIHPHLNPEDMFSVSYNCVVYAYDS